MTQTRSEFTRRHDPAMSLPNGTEYRCRKTGRKKEGGWWALREPARLGNEARLARADGLSEE